MTGFATETDAKTFFIERVLAQAQIEGVDLSRAERHALAWSESDRTFRLDPELAAELERQITDEEFEAKIGGLVRCAYERDMNDRIAKSRYRDAYGRLSEGALTC